MMAYMEEFKMFHSTRQNFDALVKLLCVSSVNSAKIFAFEAATLC